MSLDQQSNRLGGKLLTTAQLNRRKFMQGLLATGAVMTAAGVIRPGQAFAQATPLPSHIPASSLPIR